MIVKKKATQPRRVIMLDFLKGRKTYLVMAIGIIVNGAIVMGYLDVQYIGIINSILGFLGLGAIRAGISK